LREHSTERTVFRYKRKSRDCLDPSLVVYTSVDAWNSAFCPQRGEKWAQ